MILTKIGYFRDLVAKLHNESDRYSLLNMKIFFNSIINLRNQRMSYPGGTQAIKYQGRVPFLGGEGV